MRKKNFLIKCFSFFMILGILLSTFSAPISVSAHSATYLQTLIDTRGFQYTSNLVTDTPGFVKENNHLESQTATYFQLFQIKKSKLNPEKPFTGGGNRGSGGDDPLYNLRLESNNHIKMFKMLEMGIDPSTEDKDYVGSPDDDSVKQARANNPEVSQFIKNQGADYGLIFTFPSKEEGGGLFSKANDATQLDIDRAFEISNTLIPNLNGILSIVNNGQRYKDVDQLILTSIYLRPDTSNIAIVPSPNGTNYAILYGTDTTKSFKLNLNDLKKTYPTDVQISTITNKLPHVDESGNFYCYVFPVKSLSTSAGSVQVNLEDAMQFVYAMPKGYISVPIAGQIIPNNYEFVKKNEDVKYLTIHHLAFQANSSYSYRNLTSVDKSTGNNSNSWLENFIVGIFQKILYGLKSALGLYDTSELVYNQGMRGSQLYNEGTMSNDWWAVVLRYHLIFQGISWFLIILAIVKLLLQLNFSTINPSLRISLIETIQKFFTVGFLLVSIIPLVRLMTSVNNSVVGIFATQIDLSLGGQPAVGDGAIAALLIQFIYFFIFLFVNFTYIMRSIMLAILTASGPIFVVSMAFSSKGKGLFDNWLKEISANIFLQAFHAFSFAFLFNVLGASRGIEQIVVNFAIIPLTEFFRTMIFGQSGSFAVSFGQKMAGAAGQTAMSGLKTLRNKGLETASSGINKAGAAIRGRKEKADDKSRDSSTVGSKESKNSQSLSNTVKSQFSGGGKGMKALGAVAGGFAGLAQGMGDGMMGLVETGMGLASGNDHMVSRGAEMAGNAMGSAATSAVGAVATPIGYAAETGAKAGAKKIAKSVKAKASANSLTNNSKQNIYDKMKDDPDVMDSIKNDAGQAAKNAIDIDPKLSSDEKDLHKSIIDEVSRYHSKWGSHGAYGGVENYKFNDKVSDKIANRSKTIPQRVRNNANGTSDVIMNSQRMADHGIESNVEFDSRGRSTLRQNVDLDALSQNNPEAAAFYNSLGALSSLDDPQKQAIISQLGYDNFVFDKEKGTCSYVLGESFKQSHNIQDFYNTKTGGNIGFTTGSGYNGSNPLTNYQSHSARRDEAYNNSQSVKQTRSSNSTQANKLDYAGNINPDSTNIY